MRLADVLAEVRQLEATIGANLIEVEAMQDRKQAIDRKLFPFRALAMIWAGGVMLGNGACDDVSYAEIFKYIAEHGELPEVLAPSVRTMLECGTARTGLPVTRVELTAKLAEPDFELKGAPALAFDLAFPEVFYPTGIPHGRQGFDVVLGNPPWDRMLPADKEFFASFEFAIVSAPTKRERDGLQKSLLRDQKIAAAHQAYIVSFRADENIIERLYDCQQVKVNDEMTTGKQDAFRVFMERSYQTVKEGGRVGLVVPSAFHANEGSTGIRQLYLQRMALECCYSFENKRQLFEIHRSFKFANVVARRESAGTKQFRAAFYLHNEHWLFDSPRDSSNLLTYDLDFVYNTGGNHLCLLEFRSTIGLQVAKTCFRNGEDFGSYCNKHRIRLSREANMADDSWRFTPTASVLQAGEDPRDPHVAARLLDLGYLPLHEGKTFRQYDDHWGERPRYVVSLETLSDKPGWLHATRYFRVAYRNIAGPGDQNVAIWSMHPPGVLTGEKGPSESSPENRPSFVALLTLAVFNSFVPDWLLQLRVRATVSQFMLFATPFPANIERHAAFLAHSALRLVCNHKGYALLWDEQLGDTWREPNPPRTWPVLATDDDRWAIRAAIDAVVAYVYGLKREEYLHILNAFSNKSYPKAMVQCIEKFDELKCTGLEAFTRGHDPYHNIPLNKNLPQPFLELPESTSNNEGMLPGIAGVNVGPSRRRRKG